MRSIEESDFQANCLALLDEVVQSREPLRIIRKGEAIAVLESASTPAPAEIPHRASLFGGDKGLVSVQGDIMEPVLPGLDEWDAAR